MFCIKISTIEKVSTTKIGPQMTTFVASLWFRDPYFYWQQRGSGSCISSGRTDISVATAVALAVAALNDLKIELLYISLFLWAFTFQSFMGPSS